MNKNLSPHHESSQPGRNLKWERYGLRTPQAGIAMAPKRRPSADVWVFVVFALIADAFSRAFAWIRIAAYLTCLAAIGYLWPGAVSVYGLKHELFDLVFGAYLLHRAWTLLKREFFT